MCCCGGWHVTVEDGDDGGCIKGGVGGHVEGVMAVVAVAVVVTEVVVTLKAVVVVVMVVVVMKMVMIVVSLGDMAMLL